VQGNSSEEIATSEVNVESYSINGEGEIFPGESREGFPETGDCGFNFTPKAFLGNCRD